VQGSSPSRFYFQGPHGGRLRFSYLESDSDADLYRGQAFTRLYIEEMGTFPSEGPINKLQATLRSGAGVPCRMKSTCNPGGAGHHWVKACYKLDTHPQGFEVFPYEFKNPFTGETTTKRRIFIPSKVSDNRYLGNDYVANLSRYEARRPSRDRWGLCEATNSMPPTRLRRRG
jgi:Phage terminase large subunit